ERSRPRTITPPPPAQRSFIPFAEPGVRGRHVPASAHSSPASSTPPQSSTQTEARMLARRSRGLLMGRGRARLRPSPAYCFSLVSFPSLMITRSSLPAVILPRPSTSISTLPLVVWLFVVLWLI